MAHEKLTDRAELTTPAPGDLVHIVDVSDATPTSKKITVNNLMKEAPVTQVNSKTGNVTLLTTDIGEGTNLYHTDARVDARISAASVTQLSDVSSAGSGAIITTAERTTIQNNTTAISALATVASSGDYNDLNNQPSIPTKIGDLTDVQSAYGTAGQVLVVNQTANGLIYADQSGTGGGVTAVTGTAPIVVTGTTSPNVSVSLATTSSPGVMAAQDKTKLDGIETGAEVNPTASEVKTLYESNADTNALTDGLLARLNSVETGAQVNPTASEVKTLYESNTNTNAFTDAAQTKLAAITSTGSGAIITAAERTQITTNQTDIAGLATVATTGSYNDLTNKPSFVAGLSVTAPLTNTGTQTNPTLGIQAATTSVDGYLSATDKTKLNAITSTGSGAIITSAERSQITANQTAIASLPTIPTRVTDLTDVPATYGTPTQVLQMNATANALEWVNQGRAINLPSDHMMWQGSGGNTSAQYAVNSSQGFLSWSTQLSTIMNVTLDTGSNLGTGKVYTVPEDGLYEINGFCAFYNSGTAATDCKIIVAVELDGAGFSASVPLLARTTKDMAASNYDGVGGTAVMQLTKSQTVNPLVYFFRSGTGGTLSIVYSSGYIHFAIRRIA